MMALKLRRELPDTKLHCQSELTRLFRQHNPAKLSEVDKLLAEWNGREEVLVSHVQRKYEPEPELELPEGVPQPQPTEEQQQPLPSQRHGQPAQRRAPFTELSWIWADEGLFGHATARLNPLRWTTGTPREICRDLRQRKGKDAKRGIELLYTRQGGATLSPPIAMGDGEMAFANAQLAVAWVRDNNV